MSNIENPVGLTVSYYTALNGKPQQRVLENTRNSVSYDTPSFSATPTRELYAAIQHAYGYFNAHLFDNTLPDVLFTTQRQHGVMGYFAPDRWGAASGRKCHEIAINPLYVGKATLLQLLQTLTHEMVHCWQTCQGTPSRRGYHNQEWAEKMQAIGLMPSSTGQPGGKKVGQKMNDYPIEGGPFLQAAKALCQTQGFHLPWIDRFAIVPKSETLSADSTVTLQDSDPIMTQLTTALHTALALDETPLPVMHHTKTKTKYSCPDCHLNVWGKPALHLRCELCNRLLETQL